MGTVARRTFRARLRGDTHFPLGVHELNPKGEWRHLITLERKRLGRIFGALSRAFSPVVNRMPLLRWLTAKP